MHIVAMCTTVFIVFMNETFVRIALMNETFVRMNTELLNSIVLQFEMPKQCYNSK